MTDNCRRVLDLIAEDIAFGVYSDREGERIMSFQELHDHCDANTYLIDVLGDRPMSTDEDLAAWNELADEVDRELKSHPVPIP